MRTIESLISDAHEQWDDAKVLFDTGRELHDRNRLPWARKALTRCVELDPAGQTDAWAYLSYAYFRDLDAKAGEDVLRRGIEATDSDALRSTLANFSSDKEEVEKLRKSIADSEVPDVKAANLAHTFYFSDKPAEALQELTAFATENDDDADVRENLLWVLLSARGRKLVEGLDLHEIGIPLTNRVIESHPDQVRGYWMKCQMLTLEEDWEAMLETTEAALTQFPDDETMMQFRGRACRETGDEARAMDWFSRAIGAKPSFVGARIDLAKIHEKNDRIDTAEAIFREIPTANPEYAAGPVSISLFLARQERWDEAESLFIETWPSLPKWYRGGLVNNPDAKPLLEREAVKQIIEPKTED